MTAPRMVRWRTVGLVAAMLMIAWIFFREIGTPADVARSMASSPGAADAPLAKSADAGRALVSPADSDAELLRIARLMVAVSPRDALAKVQTIADLRLRERFRLAVAQAWAEQDPRAAAAWAMRQTGNQREAILQAVAKGAALQPALAEAVGSQLLAQDLNGAGRIFGAALMDAFSAGGRFDLPAEFAAQAPADFQEDWTATAFRDWARSQPADAVKALDYLNDDDLRDAAFRAAVQGWAVRQPDDLAAFALTLPPGGERTYALDQGILQWSQVDLAGLSGWLNSIPDGPERDESVTFLITGAGLISEQPDVAMQWVASLGDATAQRQWFWRVFSEWSQNDPAAARQYVENARWLGDQDRAAALQSVSTN
jgi:hypothetical protein